MAVRVWEPGLTKEEEKQIERVQKTAFWLGEVHTNYGNSLNVLGCQTLKNRRSQICLHFAKKALKHPKYRSWFTENKVNRDRVQHNTRAQKSKLYWNQCHTQQIGTETHHFHTSQIFSSEAFCWTNSHSNIVSVCVDLSHHFRNIQLYYYIIIIVGFNNNLFQSSWSASFQLLIGRFSLKREVIYQLEIKYSR